MAEPTPAELLALIEELQELVSADSYEMPDRPEFSYPAVGQAMDDEMWKFVTLALGNGVLDDGGRPYWLTKLDSDTETNQANQMRLTVATTTGTAQAVLNGFYHRLLQDIRLDFPMPSNETTYYVVLELNPLMADKPEGPISVKVYPNEMNTESGREHLILWTVTRRPNQLLTDATINRVRIRAAPSVYVWEEAHKPDPNKQLSGSLCVVGETRAIYRVSSDEDGGGSRRWVSLTDPPWTEPADSEFYGWAGSGHRRGYRRTGENSVQLRGRIKIMDNRPFRQGGGSNDAGYGILTLPPELTPRRSQRFIASSSGWAGNSLNVVTISSDGTVYGMPLLGDADWLGLDGIKYSLGD